MVRFLAAAWLLALCAAAAAQTAAPDSLTATVEETVETARQTQSSLDDWSQERRNLELRFRTAQANLAFLQERLAREDARAAALDGKVSEFERRLHESRRLQTVIQDTLDTVLGRLQSAVATDLPFLAEERATRLEFLRRTMVQPDVSAAEKLRILLEALLIEAQYGETVEAAPGTIVLDDGEIHVQILRIGRLAMFWRSPDGRRIGTWDPVRQAWIGLPGRHDRVIARALEMASRQRPTELVSLPLGRIRR